jgi:hypothetical protein
MNKIVVVSFFLMNGNVAFDYCIVFQQKSPCQKQQNKLLKLCWGQGTTTIRLALFIRT